MSKVFKRIVTKLFSPSGPATAILPKPSKPVVSPKPAMSASVTDKQDPTKKRKRTRRLASYESVLTSGSGVAGGAPVEKKQLLGS